MSLKRDNLSEDVAWGIIFVKYTEVAQTYKGALPLLSCLQIASKRVDLHHPCNMSKVFTPHIRPFCTRRTISIFHLPSALEGPIDECGGRS